VILVKNEIEILRKQDTHIYNISLRLSTFKPNSKYYTMEINFTTPPPLSSQRNRRPGHEQRREQRRHQRVVQAALDAIQDAEAALEDTDDETIVRTSFREQSRLLRRIDAYDMPNIILLQGHPLFGAIILDYYELTKSTIKLIVAEMLKQLYNFAIARFRLDTNTQGDDLWRQTPAGIEFVNDYVLRRLYRNHYMEQAITILINVSNIEFADAESITCIINWCRFNNFQYRYREPNLVFEFEALLQQTLVVDVMKPLNINVVVRQLQDENVVMTCGVCFDDVRVNETAVITGCNHVLCSGCITGTANARGIKSFILCPFCRTEISELSVPTHCEHDAVVAGLAPVVIAQETTTTTATATEEEEDNLLSYLA
jgi:hypothetical protein